MNFIFTYHQAWLIAITILAFGYAFFLYRREKLLDEIPKYLRYVMASFRFVGAWLLLVLLLGIVLERNIERKEKPLIFMANDNSASILLNKDSLFYKRDFPTMYNGLKEKLEEKYEVVTYAFADEITKGSVFSYDGKTTNISNVFTEIYSQYPNRNIGGIILASDGIYNEGLNPIYEVMERNYIPIFTIGMGDTAVVKDLRIDFLEHNNIAFLGNQFPVDVIISQTQFNGKKVKIAIKDGDKLVAAEEVVLDNLEEQKRIHFVLTANNIGFKKYSVSVTEMEDEFSYKNNSANFYMEIIDGRQKILVASDEPHPDIAALRFVIENNKNYEVVYQKTEEVKEINPYDLVVLYNYKVRNALIDDAVNKGSRPFLIVAGIGSDMRLIQGLNVGISGAGSTKEDVNVSFNADFKEILLSPEVKSTFSSAPPLTAPFGNYAFSNAIDVLAFQKIGSITLGKPLIYFTQKNASRIGVIMGEGFWRWRLFDQSRNNTTANFEMLFSKIIAYLALKENKDPFRVFVENEFTENDKVTLKAELYNKSFELINDSEVLLSFTNEEGKEFKSAFVATSDAYQLDLGNLPQGIYKWKASTNILGENFTKEGTFLVKEIKLEVMSGKADHRVLKSLSENSNGSFYLPSELDELADEIIAREDLVTIVYQEKAFDDLIDYKWIFFIVLFLISLEWGMRKYNGAY